MLKKIINVSADDLEKVCKTIKTPTAEARMVQRAKIILGFAEGKSGYQIAKELELCFRTVNKWRERYEKYG